MKTNKTQKITRKIFDENDKLSENIILKTGNSITGYFNDLLWRAYNKADRNSWDEPKLTRLSNRSFQIYRFGKCMLFELK